MFAFLIFYIFLHNLKRSSFFLFVLIILKNFSFFIQIKFFPFFSEQFSLFDIIVFYDIMSVNEKNKPPLAPAAIKKAEVA